MLCPRTIILMAYVYLLVVHLYGVEVARNVGRPLTATRARCSTRTPPAPPAVVQKTLEPTSMQKRKHQINQLAVQAASMERDLMERSGASRLTKAQTHAKYGW